MPDEKTPSLKDFDAYTDHNGQALGSESPLDIGTPARTQHDLKANPMGEAETARLASGMKGEDATDATAAETPPENLRRISDPTPGTGGARPEAAREAIARATAAVGSED